MRTFIFYNDQAIELLDETYSFNEGEKITILEGTTEKETLVTKVRKVLRKEGGNCTSMLKIYLTDAK